jgi:hypothetical protein
MLDKGMHIWFGMGSSPKDLCQKARVLCMSVNVMRNVSGMKAFFFLPLFLDGKTKNREGKK